MRVLLISPLDPKKPGQLKNLMGGESTYTKMLLQYPPKGITFVHFEQALQNNEIAYHWSYWVLLWLQKFRILPPGPRAICLNLIKDFDLIYAHGHPVRYVKNIPLVISDSSSSVVFWKYYLGWSKWRVKSAALIKYFIFTLFNIVDGEVNAYKAKQLFVFSQWAAKIKKTIGVKTQVVYPGLPMPKTKTTKRITPTIKLLFVGVWFERKGGRILLSVYRRLKRKFPNIELTIFGELPHDIVVDNNEGIVHKDFVSYQELQTAYASHDVFVHIPPRIEGYGMAVVEAMSYGMCVVVSDVCALPEFVENNKSGLTVFANSEKELEYALVRLITSSKLRIRLSREAKKKIERIFALPVFQKQLVWLFKQTRRLPHQSAD